MATFEELAQRAWSGFIERSQPKRLMRRARLMSTLGLGDEAAANAERFSVFDEVQLEVALRRTAGWMALAESRGRAEDGIEAVLDDYRGQQEVESIDSLDYSLMSFFTHWGPGRRLIGAIPPLALREPEKSIPSGASFRTLMGTGNAGPAAAPPMSGAIPNDGLEWYRDDPFANEHHEHWHVVYPGRGVPQSDGTLRVKDRHGELFFYMHQQMLARYDAERVAAGMARVAPLTDLGVPIPIGYRPVPYLSAQFGTRLAGQGFEPGVQADFALWTAWFNGVVAGSAFPPPTAAALTSDTLGDAIEPNNRGRQTVSELPNYHNSGHRAIGGVSNPGGVMLSTATAIRDPIFYEWHKQIDTFNETLRGRLPAPSFAPSPIEIRKAWASGQMSSPDLLFIDAGQLPANPIEVSVFSTQLFQRADAGEAVGRDTLQTMMVERDVLLSDGSTVVQISHLVHREFATLYRIRNHSTTGAKAVARTFIVPVATAGDPWTYIELDKFVVEVPALSTLCFARLGSESSVIRKPAHMTPNLNLASRFEITAPRIAGLSAQFSTGEKASLAVHLGEVYVGPRPMLEALAATIPTLFAPIPEAAPRRRELVGAFGELGGKPDEFLVLADEAFNYCTCGWPYNLLLPGGQVGGMAFRLFVLFDEYQGQSFCQTGCCGSLSYCGAVDSYADPRPMGYPFDRAWPVAVPDVAMLHGNLGGRDFRIERIL